jgi:hypothetical protein
MTQTMEAMNEYTFSNMQSSTSNNDVLQEKYNLEVRYPNSLGYNLPLIKLQNYFHAPLPYHIQAECDWMNSPTTSAVSTPENSPTTPSPHLSSATLNNVFPSHWPTGPTTTDPAQSIKEIQRLTDAKSVRCPFFPHVPFP